MRKPEDPAGAGQSQQDELIGQANDYECPHSN